MESVSRRVSYAAETQFTEAHRSTDAIYAGPITRVYPRPTFMRRALADKYCRRARDPGKGRLQAIGDEFVPSSGAYRGQKGAAGAA